MFGCLFLGNRQSKSLHPTLDHFLNGLVRAYRGNLPEFWLHILNVFFKIDTRWFILLGNHFFVFITLFPRVPKYCFIADFTNPFKYRFVFVHSSATVLFRCWFVNIESSIEVFIGLFDEVLIIEISIRRVLTRTFSSRVPFY